MIIALAQIQSLSHDLEANRLKHIEYILKAAFEGAHLVVFPELSLSNYDPKLANSYAIEKGDNRLLDFQQHSDSLNISISIGFPLKTEEGIQIAMAIFRPHQPPTFYAKRRLHPDENPYFVNGDTPVKIQVKDKLVSFGIWHETMFEEQIKEAVDFGSTTFIASVSKPDKGLKKAYSKYSTFSSTHGICIGMVNSIGASDDFVAAGGTAFWDEKGKLLKALPNDREGVLTYTLKHS